MSYKIAVASSDGKVINQHFGRTERFLIFQVDENGDFKFVELRQAAPPCNGGDHDDDAMSKLVDLLIDCRAVLVSQIGQGAKKALMQKNIHAFAVGDYIENALKKLISSYNKGVI